MKIEELRESYRDKKPTIESRLEELREIKSLSKERVFKELVFCLCVAQSKATLSWEAVNEMEEHGCLFNGDREELLTHMSKIRFANNKVDNIIQAREEFLENNIIDNLKGHPKEIREWVVQNVKGLGYKGATHFLRNIGIHQHLAILDVHILNKLKEFEVIDEIPKTLTPKKYLEIEEKMENFSKEIEIPMDHLDLLFWSERTGFIFK